MFIETLEFTIPVDLCDLFSTLKRGPRSNLEFPASVNSYGTTQDANIQVALRSNKLTFKVDGVSSNSSMISKSECKTLKLSVFDVDCSLAPAEQPNIIMSMSENIHHSVTHKRSYDFSVPVSSPAPKSRRISEPVQSRHIPQPQPQNTSRPSNNSESKSAIDPPVNVKQEPEDPDLIEIEPDSELNDIVPKKETPYMQIDFSSGVPHTQTSQAALDRLSHQQSSHSQSPASSSSSFHQNVPHVPDYAEPSTSQVHHGDQSADDFLVFQEDNDYGDDNDNEADYSNDGYGSSGDFSQSQAGIAMDRQFMELSRGPSVHHPQEPPGIIAMLLNPSSNSVVHEYTAPVASGERPEGVKCPECHKMFTAQSSMMDHKEAVHDNVANVCVCGKSYKYKPGLRRHKVTCPFVQSQIHG
ncbi:zinc finger protein jing homolog isoform X10 [Haliotis rufescens]|uniref:zinc finger protein jing homolog isoform X10 n=1 Tax=Haliotis rufescens TaxID=6454 RepID=UPI00201F5BDB|nr:zinc finger protein jing homolog isoform X10 [Haliotis rufescens]